MGSKVVGGSDGLICFHAHGPAFGWSAVTPPALGVLLIPRFCFGARFAFAQLVAEVLRERARVVDEPDISSPKIHF
jgi:hypothetical protein